VYISQGIPLRGVPCHNSSSFKNALQSNELQLDEGSTKPLKVLHHF
jgi:hypothetical protein